jgi:hypothetical protein
MKKHPAQRARDVVLGASVAALLSIAGYIGVTTHSSAATTTPTTVHYLQGAQAGVVSNSSNTASRGS